jgi:hypothetical protein
MRNDLRELAKLAAPVAAAPHHGFDDADSSGYVDLSAFSAKDPRWVDRELARARVGGPPPLPPPRSAAVGVVTPPSMAPVALESLLEPDETASVRPSRTKRVFYGVAALASVGVVGFLAVALARHPPPPAAAVQAPPPVALEPPPTPAAVPDTATATPVATSPAPSVTVASVAAPPATDPASRASAPKGAKTRHAAATRAAPRAATAPSPARAAAARPVSVPASPSGGGNSLMDLIKQSVAKGK